MRVTCIGGTRFIGPAIVRALLGRRHEVTLIHRGVHPCTSSGAQVVHADRADLDALRAAVASSAPDVVIDTRSMTQEDARICAAACGGVPVVVLSSQDVYAQFGRLNGLEAPEPEAVITEESPLTKPFPFRDLAAHEGGDTYDKKLVEATYQGCVPEALPSVTMLRLPAVYGRGDQQRRFGFFLDALDGGQRVFPHQNDAAFRWTQAHVDDVALATVLAAEHQLPGYRVFNVGEQDPWTMKIWCEQIAAQAGHTITWEPTSTLEGPWGFLGEMPNDVVVDTTRLREALGFEEALSSQARVKDLIESLRASRPEAD